MKRLSPVVCRTLFALFICIPAFWINSVLIGSPIWTIGLFAAAILAALAKQIPAVPRLLVFVVSSGAALLITNAGGWIAVYFITIALLFGVSAIYRQPNAAAKLVAVGFGVAVAFILAEIGAGLLIGRSEAKAAALSSPTPVPPTALLPTIVPTVPLVTVIPTLAPTTTREPAGPTTTPVPNRPAAGYGQVDFLTDGGQAAWSNMTGYGPRVNSKAHAYMYAQDGSLVYDTYPEFNGKGYRGPEAAYDKPADVYRILIIGDSFVEAVQVDYEQTFYARLIKQLAQKNTDKRRFEVVALGRVGWGTLQEYIYYQAEGVKYHADLVLLMFYINDVADNDPAFFYPGINNTNFDYVFEGDAVRLIDTNHQALPPNAARHLYNALPPLLQALNTARLLVRAFDSPAKIITPGGVLTRVHPQFYIYVKQPEVEGYAEGWRRTAWALTHFASATKANGSAFAVVSIFIGAEMIQNVAGWFPEQVRGWQWNADLPDQKLAGILAGSGAALIRTRSTFEQVASQAGSEVYKLLFIPEDGHFNARGHETTAGLIYDWLIELKIVQ